METFGYYMEASGLKPVRYTEAILQGNADDLSKSLLYMLRSKWRVRGVASGHAAKPQIIEGIALHDSVSSPVKDGP